MWMHWLLRAASSIRSASASVLASGFSQKITFLASAAATAIGICKSPGVQMSMTSMSLRSTTCCQEVEYSIHPYFSAALLTAASSRPQITFIIGSTGTSKNLLTCLQALLCAFPMKRCPIIAIFSFLFIAREGTYSSLLSQGAHRKVPFLKGASWVLQLDFLLSWNKVVLSQADTM